jgi:hypothetical protein
MYLSDTLFEFSSSALFTYIHVTAAAIAAHTNPTAADGTTRHTVSTYNCK